MYLGRNNNLCRLTVCRLCERLKALYLDYRIVRVSLVQHTKSLGSSLLNLEYSLRFTLGNAYRGFLLSLGTEYLRLLFTLGNENRRLLLTLGAEYRLAALTLSLHLLLHRLADTRRRNDVFKLHAVYLYTPRVGRFIKNGAHLGIDYIPRGQALVKLHITDNISERSRRQIFNR